MDRDEGVENTRGVGRSSKDRALTRREREIVNDCSIREGYPPFTPIDFVNAHRDGLDKKLRGFIKEHATRMELVELGYDVPVGEFRELWEEFREQWTYPRHIEKMRRHATMYGMSAERFKESTTKQKRGNEEMKIETIANLIDQSYVVLRCAFLHVHYKDDGTVEVSRSVSRSTDEVKLYSYKADRESGILVGDYVAVPANNNFNIVEVVEIDEDPILMEGDIDDESDLPHITYRWIVGPVSLEAWKMRHKRDKLIQQQVKQAMTRSVRQRMLDNLPTEVQALFHNTKVDK